MEKRAKAKWCLVGCLIVVLVLLVGSLVIPGRLAGAVKSVATNEFAGKLRALWEQEAAREPTLTEMSVESISIDKISYQPVVILKEKDGTLYLPIWIGFVEADAITVVLEGIEMPRPLTADLLCSIIDRMEASVDYIVINDLKDNTFYANLVINIDWTQMEIDSRPSDAIAIALRARVPIYVEKAVLEQAAFEPDRETGKYTTM